MAIARYSLDEGSWRYVLEPEWNARAVLSADGRRALVATNEDGVTRLRLHDGDTLASLEEIPLPGRGVAMDAIGVGDPLISRDGATAVFSFTRPASPAEVYAHEAAGAGPMRITNSPGTTIPQIEPELHRVRSFDGLEVPLFLYRPPAGGEGRPPAVAFVIHGGPEGQAVPAYNPLILHLLDSGIAVVVPNVRGSTGYGRSYTHLDDVRLRLDSVRDLAAIHDWLPSSGLDPGRAALTGGSYGGYMTLAGLAFQPGLWAAGVSIVGISSLVTFLENTSAYRRAIREREYGNLERDREFLLDASPLTHVASMRAPLLLIHGANDPRVPLSEAEQLHASLTARGVPSELVVYPDEGHGLAKLANRLDAYPRIARFLLHHLAAVRAGADGGF
jgi:dipeptidyl aminopeptidase/acylaminoacyl peptidase